MKANGKKIASTIVRYAVTVLVIAVILFPIIWMLPAAFKSKREIWQIPNTFFPDEFVFDNFRKVFELDHNGYNFLRSLGATLLVSVVSVAGSLAVNMIAAYVFARLEFRGKKFL